MKQQTQLMFSVQKCHMVFFLAKTINKYDPTLGLGQYFQYGAIPSPSGTYVTSLKHAIALAFSGCNKIKKPYKEIRIT